MRTSYQNLFTNVVSSLLLTVPMLAGCGEQTVRPTISLVDRTTKALSLGSFLEVNGDYGTGCTNRSGSWSVGLGAFANTTNPPLTVVKNDTACTLSASSVRIGSAMTNTVYSPASSFPLGTLFASNGSAFAAMMGDPVAFYGNLRVTPDLSFNTDFVIDMVYSEDPSLVSASKLANYAVQSATASAGAVSPPDYTLDLTGLSLQVDANKIVQSASGNATLGDMATLGQSYVASTNDLGATPSYAAVDAEFQSGTALAIMGNNPMLAASLFSLAGANLTGGLPRTLIVANDVAGTRSYEVFRISFNAP
jgi:hypothetical protein